MNKKIKKIAIDYKNNITLILLIIGGIFNDFTLKALTIGIKFHWKPIIANTSIILFISTITLFLSHKKRNRIFIVLSSIFSVINGANYLYYKHFHSFLSMSIIKQFKQLKDLKGSVSSTLDIRVLVFIIPTIFLYMVIKKLNKINFFEDIGVSKTKSEIFRPLIIGLFSFIIVLVTLTESDISRLVKQWNRPYLVENFGIYSYATADLIKNVLTPTKVSQIPPEEAKEIIEELVEENINKNENNKYKDIFKGRDIYIIHYESAQSFVIGKEFSSGPVTPFLNKLASEGLYFSNFYSQQSVGTSSDTEFTFNTSLLPINNGTVFMTHSDREYLTLQKLLKEEGYNTISMHGNNGDFWNRDIMHHSLGYDRFFSKNDYIIDEEIGLGLSDISFFKQSVEKIKEIKENKNSPVAATLITLTNHYPFDEVDKYGEFNVDHLEGTEIGNYLKSYHYADKALQSFVEAMDREGLLDNAIIVLYGDHHAKISNEDYEKLCNYNELTGDYYEKDDPEYVDIGAVKGKLLKRTPFIIWSKDKIINETIDKPMGMLDTLPTLGNMLGIFNPYQLGVDIMSVDDNIVPFPDASWINDKVYFSASSSKYYNLNGEEILETPDLLAISESVEDRIEVSNNIIQGDLVKVFNNFITYCNGRNETNSFEIIH